MKPFLSAGDWPLKHTASVIAQLSSAISRFLTGTCGFPSASPQQSKLGSDAGVCVHVRACVRVCRERERKNVCVLGRDNKEKRREVKKQILNTQILIHYRQKKVGFEPDLPFCF